MGHCSLTETNRQRPKNDFFKKFLCCCTSTHRDETFLFLPKFHIFSRLEKSWGDKEYENFRLKWRHRPKKWVFFGFFLSFTHLHIEAQLFISIKISYLLPFREIMGYKQNVNFQLKMTPQAKKMTFFEIFFFCCTSTHRDETFFSFIKFSYL